MRNTAVLSLDSGLYTVTYDVRDDGAGYRLIITDILTERGSDIAMDELAAREESARGEEVTEAAMELRAVEVLAEVLAGEVEEEPFTREDDHGYDPYTGGCDFGQDSRGHGDW